MKVFILVGAFLVSACGGGDSAATVSILTHEPKTPVSPRYPENLTENQYYDGTQMVAAELTGSKLISADLRIKVSASDKL